MRKIAWSMVMSASCLSLSAGAGAVAVTDSFWAPRMRLWETVTASDVLKKQEPWMLNFDRCARDEKGTGEGPDFCDGHVYEAICGISDHLRLSHDEQMKAKLDGLIARIAAAQAPDGYLQTKTLLNYPDRRFGANGGNALHQHELYNSGMLVEAGVRHYLATGETSLLKVAVRNANYVSDTIGPNGKLNKVPTHQGPEEPYLALARLCEAESALAADMGARPSDYRALVHFWISSRGHVGFEDWFKTNPRPSWGTYAQDHCPLEEQRTIEGHAVRAALFLTGVAAAVADGKEEWRAPAKRLWENMVGRKMYVTGGIGSLSDYERFGPDYFLPPDAYLETCAAVGNVFFSEQMARLENDARYMDVVETVLYNALLTAVGTNGCTYTYVNPLNSKKLERWAWHSCPCCPPMFLKLTGRIPDFISRETPEALYVDLFIGSRSEALEIETDYPAAGVVKIRPLRAGDYALKVRVPGWARGVENPFGLYRATPLAAPRLTVNGREVALSLDKGYATVRRAWKKGDEVRLTLDVSRRTVTAHPSVKDLSGRCAFAEGPVVWTRERPAAGGAWREVPYHAVANGGAVEIETWQRNSLDGRVTGLERVNAQTAFGVTSEKTWRGVAWRNERVQLPFVVHGTEKGDLRAEPPTLVGPDGARLPLSVSWVGEVLVDDRPHAAPVDPVKYPVYLSGDVLETSQPFLLTDAGYRAVWASAQVPADARPGVYRGTLTVRSDRSSVVFPIELEVLAATLPEKRKFHLDIWQTPWTIARYYGVKPFSPEHFARMEPFLRELAAAGQKAITTTITDHPWNVRENIDSARSMVRYVRRLDGTYEADFTDMDAYVAFAEKCGIGPQIHCYAPVKFERSNTYQYIDGETGEERSVTLLPATREYEAYWGPLLTQLEAHARAKGWQDRLYIALDELPGEETAATAALIAKYAPSAKFHMAGNRTPESFKGIPIDGYSQQLGSGFMSDGFIRNLAKRREEGRFTTLYTCCLPFRPNALPMSPLYEQRWLGLYIAAKGFDGYLKSTFFRWTPGADPLKDAHCYPRFPCGDSYLVYPGPRWSLRWLSLVDGIEDCEKIRVLHEAHAVTPALEAALRDIDLRKNFSNKPEVRPDKAVAAALSALEEASRAFYKR